MDYAQILQAILQDPRYQENLDWGQPRPGHPEGTVREHIKELELNLARLAHKLTSEECAKIRLLIHTHDTFKAQAAAGVPILHPQSHASLGGAFLAEFCDDADLLAMLQLHDEPYALRRQVNAQGYCNSARWQALVGTIGDWNLFLAFNLIDGCTRGKDRQTLYWLFAEVAQHVKSRFTAADIWH